MKDLFLPGSEQEPSARYNLKTGNFILEGTSRPEDAREYYKPLLDWYKNFSTYAHDLKESKEFKFIFRLSYINSISIKIIYDLLKKLEDLQQHKICIEWHHAEDDTDIRDTGMRLKNELNLNFRISEIKPL